MPTPYGALELIDCLKDDIITDFGEHKTYPQICDALDKHNKVVKDVISDLHIVTPENYVNNDPYHNYVPTQENDIVLNWDKKWLQEHKISELVTSLIGMEIEDVKNILKSVRKVVFNPYIKVDPKNKLQFKTFLNGDGRKIRQFENTKFPDYHSHFSSCSDFKPEIIKTVLNNVKEHGVKGQLRIYINRVQESPIWGMTYDFWPYMPSTNPRYDINFGYYNSGANSRAIGHFDGAEVWVKAWIPKNYMVVLDTGNKKEKPLAFCYSNEEGMDIKFVDFDETHPLRIKKARRNFGIGVANPEMMAIHYIGDSYTVPKECMIT
jgi:hypothetical protein